MRALHVALAVVALAAALALGGCASPAGRGPTRSLAAPVDVAAALGARTGYPSATEAPAAPTVAAAALGAGPTERWWQAYGDHALDALVERALADQPSLQVAQARVRAAWAAVDAAGAAGLPQVSGRAELALQHFGRNGLVPPAVAGHTRWLPQATLNLGWEPDLFGRQRAAFEAAVGQWGAARAELNAARVLLSGQVVQAWLALARQLDAHASASLAVQQRRSLLALVRERRTAGLEPATSEHAAEARLAQARGEVEALEDAARRSRQALAELSAQPPAALADAAPSLTRWPAPALPEQLPADLLGRRADLLAQRWRVEAALREVDGARAQFHPNLNLLAFAGLASVGLGRWLEAGSVSAGVGPALQLPLFEGGRLRAQLDARAAEADAAIEAYNAALRRALREVAEELGSLRSLDLQLQAQQEALAAARAGLQVAEQRRRAGLASQLAVLDAEADVLQQQRAAAELRGRRLATDAALQLALGGGFRAEAPPALR